MKETKQHFPHPVTYQSPKTLEPTSYSPWKSALAHKATIPTEGVRFTIKNNIYIIHQLELKQQQS